MFHSLRSKLIASYVVIVFLCLILFGTATGIIIARTQRTTYIDRMQTLGMAVLQRLTAEGGLTANVSDLIQRLRRESALMNVRLLLLDGAGGILFDSTAEGPWIDQGSLPLPSPQGWATLPGVRHYKFGDGIDYLLLYIQLPDRYPIASYLVIAIPTREVSLPWQNILRPLVLAALIAMGVAAAVAFLLAESISKPIVQMTDAAGQIAQGKYSQTIPSTGDDEVARLAQRFTHMAQEVERAQRSQRDFLANITHDLRTPLTSIQGFSQAILEGQVTDEEGYHRAAEIIHSEADRMARLVQDLLDLARLETGHLDLAPQPISIGQVLAAEVQAARERRTQPGVEIAVTMPEDLPGVMADPVRIRQAFCNLLDNACKYSRPNGRVTVEATQWSDQVFKLRDGAVAFGSQLGTHPWIHVCFTNQGEVIPPDDLPRIFERFYRGDKSRKQTEGSGLGLAIVREIILAHGGRLEASSDFRETRFDIWLPITDARK